MSFENFHDGMSGRRTIMSTQNNEKLSKAALIKKDQEEAYKNPPKVMPYFPTIQEALRAGGKIYAYLSKTSLRIVIIYKNQ